MDECCLSEKTDKMIFKWSCAFSRIVDQNRCHIPNSKLGKRSELGQTDRFRERWKLEVASILKMNISKQIV